MMKLAREQVQQNQYSTELWTIPVERKNGVLLKPVTSKLSWFHGMDSSSDSKGEVGMEIIGFG